MVLGRCRDSVVTSDQAGLQEKGWLTESTFTQNSRYLGKSEQSGMAHQGNTGMN